MAFRCHCVNVPEQPAEILFKVYIELQCLTWHLQMSLPQFYWATDSDSELHEIISSKIFLSQQGFFYCSQEWLSTQSQNSDVWGRGHLGIVNRNLPFTIHVQISQVNKGFGTAGILLFHFFHFFHFLWTVFFSNFFLNFKILNGFHTTSWSASSNYEDLFLGFLHLFRRAEG